MTGQAQKRTQSWAGLWNISFGFFGIQIGFALQNANMSRIFQSLGAEIEKLPALWVAAPLTGLLVQPIIGHMSDKTWLGRLGRRRPYFLAGAILAAFALFVMPASPAIWFAAMMLWVLDASLNVSMEPFRAFVGDMLKKDQHAAGYAVQTAFIGAGAFLGSVIPWWMDQIGVSNVAAAGQIPDTVRYSFWIGGAALFSAVLWTVLTTKEYSPEEMAAFNEAQEEMQGDTMRALAAKSMNGAGLWVLAGGLVIAAVLTFGLEKEVYLLGALLIAYGLLSAIAIAMAKSGKSANMLSSIVGDFSGMPDIMKKLAVVQFFSWSALFIMWINTTPIVTQYFYGATDTSGAAYNEGANYVGWMFAVYNAVAAVAALALLPWLSRRIGQAKTHMVGLLCGAIGYASFFVMPNADWLMLSEVFVGIFWASVLAMPYAILASNLPQGKLGIYMGLFNVFVVVPQLLVATVMGSIMKAFFPGQPIYTMAFAAVTLLIAAAAMTRVDAALKTKGV